MVDDELPAEVRQLIAEQITSVEQLEILLFVRGRPNTKFTATKVSEEIRTSPRSAGARLADLHARGFVGARHEGDTMLFWYEPSSEERRRTVDKLAQAYLERRYTVIDLIFSKPIGHLQLYADAFRFRRKSDG